MDLNFSLEDIEIEINVDPEDTEGASVSQAEVAEDNRVDEEVEEQVEEVENILAFGNQVSETIDNLFMIHNHVARFGFNKPMLDLLNADNKIGNLIGRTLPTFESDELPEEVEIPEDVDIEMALESIMDRIKGAGRAIVEFFKKLYEKIVDFFTKHFGQAQRLEKKLEKLKSYLTDKFEMDADKAKSKEITSYGAKTLKMIIQSGISTLTGEISGSLKALAEKATEAAKSLDTEKAPTSDEFDKIMKDLFSEFEKPENNLMKALGIEIKFDIVSRISGTTNIGGKEDEKGIKGKAGISKFKVKMVKSKNGGQFKREKKSLYAHCPGGKKDIDMELIKKAIEVLKKKREVTRGFKTQADLASSKLANTSKEVSGIEIGAYRTLQRVMATFSSLYLRSCTGLGAMCSEYIGLGFSLPKKKD